MLAPADRGGFGLPNGAAGGGSEEARRSTAEHQGPALSRPPPGLSLPEQPPAGSMTADPWGGVPPGPSLPLAAALLNAHELRMAAAGLASPQCDERADAALELLLQSVVQHLSGATSRIVFFCSDSDGRITAVLRSLKKWVTAQQLPTAVNVAKAPLDVLMGAMRAFRAPEGCLIISNSMRGEGAASFTYPVLPFMLLDDCTFSVCLDTAMLGGRQVSLPEFPAPPADMSAYTVPTSSPPAPLGVIATPAHAATQGATQYVTPTGSPALPARPSPALSALPPLSPPATPPLPATPPRAAMPLGEPAAFPATPPRGSYADRARAASRTSTPPRQRAGTASPPFGAAPSRATTPPRRGGCAPADDDAGWGASTASAFGELSLDCDIVSDDPDAITRTVRNRTAVELLSHSACRAAALCLDRDDDRQLRLRWDVVSGQLTIMARSIRTISRVHNAISSVRRLTLTLPNASVADVAHHWLRQYRVAAQPPPFAVTDRAPGASVEILACMGALPSVQRSLDALGVVLRVVRAASEEGDRAPEHVLRSAVQDVALQTGLAGLSAFSIVVAAQRAGAEGEAARQPLFQLAAAPTWDAYFGVGRAAPILRGAVALAGGGKVFVHEGNIVDAHWVDALVVPNDAQLSSKHGAAAALVAVGGDNMHRALQRAADMASRFGSPPPLGEVIVSDAPGLPLRKLMHAVLQQSGGARRRLSSDLVGTAVAHAMATAISNALAPPGPGSSPPTLAMPCLRVDEMQASSAAQQVVQQLLASMRERGAVREVHVVDTDAQAVHAVMSKLKELAPKGATIVTL